MYTLESHSVWQPITREICLRILLICSLGVHYSIYKELSLIFVIWNYRNYLLKPTNTLTCIYIHHYGLLFWFMLGHVFMNQIGLFLRLLTQRDSKLQVYQLRMFNCFYYYIPIRTRNLFLNKFKHLLGILTFQ